MKRLGQIFVIVTLVYVAFMPAMASGQFFYFMENPHVGKQVPDIDLLTMTGEKIKLSDNIKGQRSIVFFWATWCPHCKRQLSDLNKIRDEFKTKNIKIIPVDSGETKRTVQNYIKKHNIQIPILLDMEDNSTDIFELVGVPTFYYVNKNGIVTAVEHELLENYDEVLDQEI